MKTPQDREGRASSYRLACPGLNDCVPLRECPQILAEATSRCYNHDRSLFCGANGNFEPFVCCPITYTSPPLQADYGGNNNGNNNNNNVNYQDKLSGSCGKPLIQGSYYKKLGAYPFAARIGFKSELIDLI